MTRTIDATPTWAGLMPALVACLQNGSPEGAAIATEELLRLARAVDSGNAAAREEAAKPARAGMEATHARRGRALAARDLEGAARDFMTGGAFIRAACYWEAAARIAPPDMEEARDFRVSADLAEREAAALQTRGYDLARKEERADIAAAFAQKAAAFAAPAGPDFGKAAANWAAALAACPDSINAPAWAAKRQEAAARANAEEAGAYRESILTGRMEGAFDIVKAAEDAKAGKQWQAAASLFRAAHIAAPDALGAAGWKRESLACQEEAREEARLARLWAGFGQAPRSDMLQALDMARACLAAYPEGGPLPVPAARARDAARDLRESLADLVATFGKGGQA